MKTSKIKSRLIDVWRVRPIFVVAVLVLLLDLIYVNLFFNCSGDLTRLDDVSITGKVRDKAYDENGVLKSITVGEALCYVNKDDSNFDCSLGSVVRISGSFDECSEPMNLGEFDSLKYYAAKGIFYTCFYGDVKVLKVPVFSLREKCLDLRLKASAQVLKYCPLEGGTVNTLLWGDKSNLSLSRKLLYQRAGVAHFLVISGLHISAVGSFIYAFLKRLGVKRPVACGISLAFLIIYGMIVGFSVSVLRAVIMFGVRLFADIVKRIYDMLNAVSFALIITVLTKPLVVWDSAFVYSYVTVFSIAFYVTYLHPKAYRRIGIWGKVRETLRLPVVIFLFVMPVSLCLSYQYSLASVFVNTLLMPVSAPILFMAFLGFAFSAVGWRAFAGFFDFCLALVLRIFDFLCELISGLHWFDFSGKPEWWMVVLYYLVLFIYFYFLKDELANLYRALVLMGAVSCVGAPWACAPTLSMLYVGQGECMVFKTSMHEAFIVDCGSTSKTSVGQYIILPYLKAAGIRKISGIFCTHSDEDHMGEAGWLCQNAEDYGLEVLGLFMPNLPDEYKDDLFNETCDNALSEDIPVFYIDAGDRIFFKSWDLSVLWPSASGLTGDSNADSLVMLASCGDFDALLTGDATQATEEQVLSHLPSRIDVLKVAHHGSKTGTSEALLNSVDFDCAIISAGIDNRYGHPHLSTTSKLTAAGIPYYCTKDCGEIDFTIGDRSQWPTFYHRGQVPNG